MTKQETFNVVAKHLKKQGVRSNYRGRCLYRGPNGLKCAAGVLIPDNYYEDRLEGSTASTLLVGSIIKGLGHDVELVIMLQTVHDLCEPNDWDRELATVASYHGLTYKQEGIS